MSCSFCVRKEETEQLKAANNSLMLELERYQGLEVQLQVLLLLLLPTCSYSRYRNSELRSWGWWWP